MQPKINTLIFDCFGVICEPVLNGWYRDNRLSKGLVDDNLKKILEKSDLGVFSEDDVLDYFSKYNGIAATKTELREEIDSYLKVDPELVEIIKKIKINGFKIVLLTNANSSFFYRKVYPTYPEFKELFDEIIISSEIGMTKPHKEIFEYTLKKINTQAEESLFIDDSQVNVDGACALGIHGFTYTNCSSFKNYLMSLGIDLL